MSNRLNETAVGIDVVLLEFADEVDAFCSYCATRRLSPSSFHVVALWPEVQVKLRQRGIAYVNTLPYFSNDSHRHVVLRSEEWLKVVESAEPLTDSAGTSESYTREVTFQLRFYFTYFLWILEILGSVTAAHRVRSLVVFEGGKDENASSGPGLRSNARHLSAIVRAYATAHGLPCTVGRSQRFAAGTHRMRRWVRRQVARPGASALAWFERARLREFKSKPTIVVTSLGYNMGGLVRRLRRRFPETVWVLLEASPANPLRRLRHLQQNGLVDGVLSAAATPGAVRCVKGDPLIQESLARAERLLATDWAGAFISSGVSFVAIFRDRIRRELLPWIREMAAAASRIRMILEALRPRLVMSPFAIGPVASVGELCKQLGIPSLSISHGMLSPPQNDVDAVEAYRLGTGFILTTYGYTALQSPWTERYFESFPNGRRPLPLRTGSLILSRRDPTERPAVRRRLFGIDGENQKVVVYATTLKSRSSMRLQTHETLDEHLAALADIVRSTTALPQVHLLIKLHPAGALREREVRSLVDGVDSPRVAIATELPFRQVLSAADILVSYSSTCIEEGIQSGIPVLLYDRWARYQHLPAARLDRATPEHPSPIYYITDPSSLTAALTWITEHHDSARIPADVLREHIYPPDVYENFVAFINRQLRAR